MIPIEQLEQMFEGMRAQSKWNVDGPLLWGYFFTDSRMDPLREVAIQLTKEGYRYAGSHQADEKPTYVLHMERVEQHSPQSLYERNAYLEGVAKRFGVGAYDGMDVGPAPV